MPTKWVYGQNAYYIDTEEGYDGPFCMGCFDKEKMKSASNDRAFWAPRLQTYGKDWRCPVCGNLFTDVNPPSN
jgi:hypothetical protein